MVVGNDRYVADKRVMASVSFLYVKVVYLCIPK